MSSAEESDDLDEAATEKSAITLPPDVTSEDKQAKEEDAIMALLQMGEQREPSHKYIDKDTVRFILHTGILD